MKSKLAYFMILFAFPISLTGQDANFKDIFLEADYYLQTGNFQEALKYYERLYTADQENANLNFLCGYCCLKVEGGTHKTISFLEMATQHIDPDYKEGSYKERNAPDEVYFQLGKVYHINNEFDKAIEHYLQYSNSIDKRKFANIEYVNAHIKACETGKSMVTNPINANIDPLDDPFSFNYDVYNPVVSGNDSILIFLAERPISISIMMSVKENNGWSEPEPVNHEIGLTGNTYPVCLSYDGTELYLVYNDYFNSDIYVSNYLGRRWSRAVPLNKEINTRYVESHAAISRDGRTLYFTSDRKGGQGGLDIYKAERMGSYEWDNVENLGPGINTYYNEEAPFLTNNDQKLYFSSQGHNTMGGYDIFYCGKIAAGIWSIPENIGYPVNTSGDDLFYNPGWNDAIAYYSLKPDDNISNKSLCRVRIIPFDDMSIGMKGVKDEQVSTSNVTTESGHAEKSDAKHGVTFASLGIYYILNNILFDYDSYSLNEKAQRDVERVLSLLYKFPEINLELTGHTDAKGSVEYNMRLSYNRAQAVADYLIENGIDPGRLLVKSAGEQDPVAINEYEDGSDAPEGRELNRHVSLKITNLNNEQIKVADIFVPDELIPSEDQDYSIVLLQSAKRKSDMPNEFLGEEVSMISTDSAWVYFAGNFKNKSDAVKYLNESIDNGYPDATMVESKEMEYLVQDNSSSGPYESITYTIQFIALRNPKDVSYFDNLSEVKRYMGKDGLYRYTSGFFRDIDQVMDELVQVRKKGYIDAFVVPLSRYEILAVN